jgi:formylglycine-generating enzyme
MKTRIINILLFIAFTVLLMSSSCDDTTKPNPNNNNNTGGDAVITSVTNNPTYAGYPVTISGSKFGFSSENAYVSINGKKAVKYIYWSYDLIIAMLPDDASTGKLTVVVAGKSSNEYNVTINPVSTGNAPIIKAFDTNKPFVRSSFGIEGSNFGDGQNGNFVTINGILVTNISTWKDKKVVVEVPTGATSGDVIVYVNGLKSNAMYLEIQSDNILLEQVLIPGGEFMMGADDELSGFSNPKHKVIITRPFYISKYEISQGVWDEVSTISHNSYNKGPNNPVERVSWLNCCKFCNALSIREKFKSVYTITGEEVAINWDANGYRLPTEAEWELAARAGGEWRYGKGQDGANGVVSNIAWHNENSSNSTHEIGQKEPNLWGIHDMLGNVKEWCWDWFDAEYYTTSKDSIDPKGPNADSDGGKSLRGGSYTEDKVKTTCSYRWGEQHTVQSEYYIGFRVVRNAR